MLAEATEQFGVGFWASRRMPNHIHFGAVLEDECSRAICFGKAHTACSRRTHFPKGWRGTSCQVRFPSRLLEEQHAWHAPRYVERKPVPAKSVRVAWSCEGSSAAYHGGLRETDALIHRMPMAAQTAWQPVEKGDGPRCEKISSWAKRNEAQLETPATLRVPPSSTGC